MSHTPHYLTRSGRRFYDHTMPELLRQVTRLADVLERLEARIPPAQDEADEPADTEAAFDPCPTEDP